MLKQIQLKRTNIEQEIEIPKNETTAESIAEVESERNIEITFAELNNKITSLTAQL
ncbi:hypothetical protein WwAna1710 [Wolbachia endosymbiont of Drosophila ananassae]|nr:hypothetical protein WwAna1710 [Wolbachia endosymbiont of Drosophila ananassae]